MSDVAASLLEQAQTHWLVVEEDLAAGGTLHASGNHVEEGFLAATWKGMSCLLACGQGHEGGGDLLIRARRALRQSGQSERRLSE